MAYWISRHFTNKTYIFIVILLCFKQLNHLTLFPIEKIIETFILLEQQKENTMLILYKQYAQYFFSWPSRGKICAIVGVFILVVMRISWYLWAGNTFQIAFHNSILIFLSISFSSLLSLSLSLYFSWSFFRSVNYCHMNGYFDLYNHECKTICVLGENKIYLLETIPIRIQYWC